MESEIHSFYGNKTRIRICGICERNGMLLMINHRGITEADFWAPPGGGLNFGETAEDCLRREFVEETGLTVKVEEFLFACELARPPLHAIELFFRVTDTSGQLKAGYDPELGSPAIIQQTEFMTWQQIASLPTHHKHGIFHHTKDPSHVLKLSGFFKL